jgi:hypothetical protein
VIRSYVLYYDADKKEENFNGQDIVFGLKCDRWGSQNSVIKAYSSSSLQHCVAVQVNFLGFSNLLGFVYQNLNVNLSTVNEYPVLENYLASANSTYVLGLEYSLSLVS